jgi:hypothetical protein
MYAALGAEAAEAVGEVGMRGRRVLLAAGLALVSTAVAADAASIQDFAGAWQGVELHASDSRIEATPDDLDLKLSPEDDGFRLEWTTFARTSDGHLQRRQVDARFAPTDRPGVFAFRPDHGSFFSRLFADPATANPLKGETLLWARLDGATLTVYSLAIDNRGGFDLNRYARTLTDGGMTVRYTHRIENDVILSVEGRVEKAGS